MIKKITFMRFALSFVIALCFALMPIRSEAEVLTASLNCDYVFYDNDVFLDNTYVSMYGVTSDQVFPEYVEAIYEGNIEGKVELDLNAGHLYSGRIFQGFKFVFDTNEYTTVKNVDVSISPVNIEGVNLTVSNWSTEGNNYVFSIVIELHGVIGQKSTIHIPLNFDIKLEADIDNTLSDQVEAGINCVTSLTNAGQINVWEFTDLQDYYGVDGYFSRQNQEIIDGIDENTSAVNTAGNNIVSEISDAATYIGNQIKYYIELFETSVTSNFNQLTSNLSNWYNGLISNLNTNIDRILNQNNEEHEETINGYQGTGTSDASDKFDQSAGELESIESDLTGITNSSIGSYTDTAFDTTVITSLGSSLVYVVTWFTNFWNMGGLFTSILNVGLALSVAFFILRLRGAD